MKHLRSCVWWESPSLVVVAPSFPIRHHVFIFLLGKWIKTLKRQVVCQCFLENVWFFLRCWVPVSFTGSLIWCMGPQSGRLSSISVMESWFLSHQHIMRNSLWLHETSWNPLVYPCLSYPWVFCGHLGPSGEHWRRDMAPTPSEPSDNKSADRTKSGSSLQSSLA